MLEDYQISFAVKNLTVFNTCLDWGQACFWLWPGMFRLGPGMFRRGPGLFNLHLSGWVETVRIAFLAIQHAKFFSSIQFLLASWGKSNKKFYTFEQIYKLLPKHEKCCNKIIFCQNSNKNMFRMVGNLAWPCRLIHF